MFVELDSDVMEDVLFRLKKLYSETEECFAALKSVIGELSEDESMLLLPETHLALCSLEPAAGRLYALESRLWELERAMSGAPDNFRECEEKLEKKIRVLSSELDALTARVQAAAGDTFGAGAGYSDEEANAASLDALVGQQTESLEMSNLAALGMVIGGEYGEAEDG